MNLIPETPGKTPSYWCTWRTQNYGLDYIPKENRAAGSAIGGNIGAGSPVQDCLNEKVLFESPGWAVNLFDRIRGDVYFMMDQGWDVPFNTDDTAEVWKYGSLELPAERFPSIIGNPAERLQKLNERIQTCGWRGLGIWVASQMPGDSGNVPFVSAAVDKYWRERARWSRPQQAHPPVYCESQKKYNRRLLQIFRTFAKLPRGHRRERQIRRPACSIIHMNPYQTTGCDG